MATTVNDAFREFLGETVNLDREETRVARSSRGWLLDQIAQMPARRDDVPALYPDIDIFYGSFERRTKIRPLDDIDVIVGLNGLGGTYETIGGEIRLTAPEGTLLRDLCHDGTALLNSRKVINTFVRGLADVPQYERAQINRNGSAAVLNLRSYPWSYDIVPGFLTMPELDGRTYYIIPNGDGHWMKTDPRIDRERLSSANQQHGGQLLNPLRIMKYWNRRPTMPTMPSYMLECMIVRYYEALLSGGRAASPYVDLELQYLLEHVSVAVNQPVPDPKGIQGDLNTLGWDERVAVAVRAVSDRARARQAFDAEHAGEHRAAIGLWSAVLGTGFPVFG
jgi:hypothetical protein